MQNDLFHQRGFEVLPLAKADVRIWRGWLAHDKARILYTNLVQTLEWSQPTIIIAGQARLTPRWQCWVGSKKAVYSYSGTRFNPLPWTEPLLELKRQLQQSCDTEFNSALINWYRTGQDSVSWHADDEPELGPAPVIASLSLGVTRRFLMRPNQRDAGTRAQTLDLNHGDLLLMQGLTQQNWQHCIPKMPKLDAARINLTFRYVHSGG